MTNASSPPKSTGSVQKNISCAWSAKPVKWKARILDLGKTVGQRLSHLFGHQSHEFLFAREEGLEAALWMAAPRSAKPGAAST